MSPLRSLARPLLASAFIIDGLDALRNTDEHAATAEPLAPTLAKVGGKVPGLPTDSRTLTRLIGAVQVGAGVLLATGKAPRVAAGTLGVIAIPTMLLRHPVWTMSKPERSHHLSALLRDAALLGGLIFAAQDRQGKPSLTWQYGNWRGQRAELGELRGEHRDEVRELRDRMRAKVKAAKQSGKQSNKKAAKRAA